MMLASENDNSYSRNDANSSKISLMLASNPVHSPKQLCAKVQLMMISMLSRSQMTRSFLYWLPAEPL